MNEYCLTDLAARVLAHDLLRYVLGAGGVYLVVNVVLATGPLAGRQIRARRPGWRQMRREIVIGLRTVLVFTANGTFITWGAVTGMLPVYGDMAEYGPGWLVGTIVLVIVAHDTWFYWMHRLIHHRRLFGRVHQLHHRSRNPTPFTSYAFDVPEAAGHAVFLTLFLALVPMHPAGIMIFAIHMMLRNAIGHSGYEVFPARADGRPLLDWISTVTHHDLHHAAPGYNFGLYFTWWDRWMGTEHPQYHARFRAAVSTHRAALQAQAGTTETLTAMPVPGAPKRPPRF